MLLANQYIHASHLVKLSCLSLIVKGLLNPYRFLIRPKNLPSFGARLDTYFEGGDSVQKTRDLATTFGIVTLCNADAKMLERDVHNSFVLWKNKTNSLFLLMGERMMMGKKKH